MQQRRAAERARVGQRLDSLGRVEDELDRAVGDGVDDVRPAFRDLVDLMRLHAVLLEVAAGAPGGPDLEAEPGEHLHRVEQPRLVDIAHRYEDRARDGHLRAATELALGERHVERRVEADDLAGRAHLRPQHRVDAGEAGEGEHRLLHADMVARRRLQREGGELLAGHDPRRDLGDGHADHLGDEGHGARRPRVDLENVDVAALDGVLHVHQTDDVERQCQFARLGLERGQHIFRKRARRQRAGGIAGMDAGLLDMLHDAGDEDVGAVAERVDVDLDRVDEIAVEEQRILAQHRIDLPGLVVGIARLDLRWHQTGKGPEQIIVEAALVVQDRHGAAAQHVRGPRDERQAEVGGDVARLLDGIGDAVLRLAQAEFLDQSLEPVTILGEIDRIDRGAEDRNAGLFQRRRELQRRLAAELDDGALEGAVGLLDGHDLEHVLGGQRLEIEPPRRVVVGRNRFRVAIDHDGLVALVAQREGGVAAAIVELDALADAVWSPTEDNHLGLVGGQRLVHRRTGAGCGPERGRIGRVHVGGRRGELGGAGVDALVDRPNAERVARRPDLALALPRQRGEPRVGKASGLEPAHVMGVLGQAVRLHLALEPDDLFEPVDEPGVDAAGLENLGLRHAAAQRLADDKQAIRRRQAERGAQHVAVLAWVAGETLDFDLVEPVEAGLERTQRLLQAFREGAADRHRLADRLHRGGQDRLGAGEFLEGEAWDLCDDIVDRRLERGRRRAAGDVVGDLVERVADGELRRDLGDGEACRLRGQSGRARYPRVHLDDDHLPRGGVDSELDIAAAGLDADLAQHRQGGVAHDLVFLVGQRQRRRHRDGIAGVDAHRVDVLDRADDDAIVPLVADNLHLVFLPTEHALLDEHLVGGGRIDPALDDLDIFALGIGDAATCAAHCERRADDRRQADVVEDGERTRQRLDLMRARRRQADLGHRLAEFLAVLGLVDRLRRGADHLDVVLLQRAHLLQRERAIERGLAAHGRQQGEAALHGVALLGDDLRHHFRRDRLDIGAVGEIGIGHDRRRVRVHQHDAVALGLQRLQRLRAGIVELARLPDDDRPGADNQDGRDVGPFRHDRSRRDASRRAV